MTGPWRLRGTDASLDDQAIDDLAYVRDYRIWEDVRIVIFTLWRSRNESSPLGRWETGIETRSSFSSRLIPRFVTSFSSRVDSRNDPTPIALAGDVAVDLSILIVSWNTRDLLRDCLRSVYKTVTGLSFEVLVVDNASDDGVPRWFDLIFQTRASSQITETSVLRG